MILLYCIELFHQFQFSSLPPTRDNVILVHSSSIRCQAEVAILPLHSLNIRIQRIVSTLVCRWKHVWQFLIESITRKCTIVGIIWFGGYSNASGGNPSSGYKSTRKQKRIQNQCVSIVENWKIIKGIIIYITVDTMHKYGTECPLYKKKGRGNGDREQKAENQFCSRRTISHMASIVNIL